MLLNPSESSSGVKRSLILAGGGMRVAYQAGVLRALEEAGFSYHHVDGTSGGTINTAMLFSGLSPVEMCQRWSTLNISDFVSMLPLVHYFKPHKLKAMGDADGIIEKVFPHLGLDLTKINRTQTSHATFNVCNHSTKQNLAIRNEDVTLSHLIAGISLPLFMPAVEIEGDLYTDSVWIKDANLMEAVKRGAEELWLVWCIGNSHDFKSNPFLQYVHMIELSANGGLLEEFNRILEINKRIQNGDSPYGQKRPIVLHVIKPPFPIPLDPDLYFGRINGQELVSMGYQHAQSYLSNRQVQGLEFNWRATSMSEPGTTIVFRQILTAKTNLYQKKLQIKMRAEAYQLNSADIDNQTISLFAEFSLEDFAANIPATAGVMKLRGMAEEDSGFEMQFNTQEPVRIIGKISSLSLWKMFLGLRVRVHVCLYKGDTKEIYDTALIKISIFTLMRIYAKMQIKECSGLLQSLNLKWQYIVRYLLSK